MDDAPASSVATDSSPWPPSERAALCGKYIEIFALRNRTDEGAVDGQKQLFASTPSALLRHEIAYALGQMQRLDAVPFLSQLLTDTSEDPVVRHEAAEALGAIGEPASIELLRKHATDAAPEVSDTRAVSRWPASSTTSTRACARARSGRRRSSGSSTSSARAMPPSRTSTPRCGRRRRGFVSVDPAPGGAGGAHPHAPRPAARHVPPALRALPCLFALRDAVPAKGEEAVNAICAAFSDTNALLKHEVAFVLGQLEHSASVAPLCDVISCESERRWSGTRPPRRSARSAAPRRSASCNGYAEHEQGDLLRESVWVALHMYDREAFLAKGVCA